MSTRTHYDNLPPVDAKAITPDLPPVPELGQMPPPAAPTIFGTTSPYVSSGATATNPTNTESNNNDHWKDFDFDKSNTEDQAVRPLPRRETIRFIAAGLIGGALVWLSQLALENWAMKPLFCRTPDTASVCVNADTTSFIIALVVVGIIMSALLSNARVFRSVLITMATFVSLGALWPMLNGKELLIATLAMALFGTALYLFFALTAALKKFLPAIFLLAALTVGFWFLVRM
jgi:hypothetical protein